MYIKDFYDIVELKRTPKVSMLRDLQLRIKKTPYFQADIFIYIKCLYLSSPEAFSEELARLAPFISDRKALFYYVMNDEYKQFQKKAEKKLSADRTNILINAFFDTLDDQGMDTSLDNLINTPNLASVDYFSYLESIEKENKQTYNLSSNKEMAITKISPNTQIDDLDDIDSLEMEDGIEFSASPPLKYKEENKAEDEAHQLKHQEIIDTFIANAADKNSLRIQLPEIELEDGLSEDEMDEPNPDWTESELEENFFFTQTLVDIYIKQKKYERAYEIIKRLSLNYPEKNIYFADQLAILDKKRKTRI